MTLSTLALLLIEVALVVVLLLIFLCLPLVLIAVLLVTETPIEVLVGPIVVISCALAASAARRLRGLNSISPAACLFASVHF